MFWLEAFTQQPPLARPCVGILLTERLRVVAGCRLQGRGDYYNLCHREEEREMIRFCKETGIGIIPWSPLFAGRLARPLGYDRSLRSKRPSPHHPGLTPADEEIISRVEKLATERGWKMSQVTLAWTRIKGPCRLLD